MSPAKIGRIEAVTAGHQKTGEADMALMERIARISQGGQQPSTDAAIAAECRL